jgi:DNA replication and repair protein RecF
MSLTCLRIRNLRNLTEQEIHPTPLFNLITGPNGSGKTSVLEAIHLLSLGRSFRTTIHQRLIQHHQASLTIYGEVSPGIPLGIEKHRSGENYIRISGENKQSVAELAKCLPVQVINADSFKLLDAGPQHRRQFMDWGVFHVKHSFLPAWQSYRQAMKQRNAALRQRSSSGNITLWETEMVKQALVIDEARRDYIEQYIPVLQALIQDSFSFEVELDYARGWPQDEDFALCLQHHRARDAELSYTQQGPHRADLKIKSAHTQAQHVLSRGQQKSLVCAMRIAQGNLVQQFTERPTVYLVDDLVAELDARNSLAVLRLLHQSQAQVFITVIEPTSITALISDLDFSIVPLDVSRETIVME